MLRSLSRAVIPEPSTDEEVLGLAVMAADFGWVGTPLPRRLPTGCQPTWDSASHPFEKNRMHWLMRWRMTTPMALTTAAECCPRKLTSRPTAASYDCRRLAPEEIRQDSNASSNTPRRRCARSLNVDVDKNTTTSSLALSLGDALTLRVDLLSSAQMMEIVLVGSMMWR